MESAEFLEREIKLMALPNSLRVAQSLAISMGGREITGCGVDCYWAHSMHPDMPVVRHRYNDGVGQLTIKKQVEGGNSVREEVNLELASASLREVTKLLEMQGYERSLEIAKVSHNWVTDDAVLSWYSVMDLEGSLLHTPEGMPCKFFEVELREDIDWSLGRDPESVLEYYLDLLRDYKIARVIEPRSLWQLLGDPY